MLPDLLQLLSFWFFPGRSNVTSYYLQNCVTGIFSLQMVKNVLHKNYPLCSPNGFIDTISSFETYDEKFCQVLTHSEKEGGGGGVY